jgi:import inner membrane translocase subunit TIM44
VKFEESDSPLARGARLVTDKVQDIFGGIFTRTELSATLTEIVKIDPTFEREQFLKECESDIIPNILEAITSGNLEILEDWWVPPVTLTLPPGVTRLPSTCSPTRCGRRRSWA